MLTRAGKPVRFVGSAHDITRVKSLKLPGVDSDSLANLMDIGATGFWRDKEILKHRVSKNGYTTANLSCLQSATEHLLKSLKSEEKPTKSLKRTASSEEVNCGKKQCLSATARDLDAKDTKFFGPKFFYRNQPSAVTDEIVAHNQPPVSTVSDCEVMAMDRCRCVSGILRGLSFVPTNDAIIAKQEKLLLLLGKVLLLHHTHLPNPVAPKGRETEVTSLADSDAKDKVQCRFI